MRESIIVYTGGTSLRPLARNLIRAAALTAGFSVQFHRGIDCTISADGEEYASAQVLLNLLSDAMPGEELSEELHDALKQLTDWLLSCCGRLDLPEDLPSLQDVLKETSRQSDYRTAGKPEPKWQSFWALWKTCYAIPQDFETIGSSQINEVNLGEASDYLDAHLKTAGEVSYMKHAVESLLSSVPADVESILDIGSGPGYVNRWFPADYSILAMDIEEEILRGNSRRTCLGDIMDIPLADRSVDMSIACDMLEHLPDDVLEKGAKELERVSAKYIYLQIPFQEDPQMAFAHCPKCGNIWHVNHHKRTFNEERLRSVLSDEWEPVIINYTGDIRYRRNGQMAVHLAEKCGWKTYYVQGSICPLCGTESQLFGENTQRLARRLAEFDTDSPFPVYTELGILFCRAGVNAEIPKNTGLYRCVEEDGNTLCFRLGIEPQDTYTGTEMLPSLYLSECYLSEVGEALHIKRLADTEGAWVAISFPPAKQDRDSSVVITGCVSEPDDVRVSLLDDLGEETSTKTWHCSGQDTTCQIPLLGDRIRAVYVKISFRAEEMILHDCRITNREEKKIYTFVQEKPGFLSFSEGRTEIRFYVPPDKKLFLSHSPEQWRKLTNDEYSRMERAIARFINDVLQSLPAGNDNRKLIDHSLCAESVWKELENVEATERQAENLKVAADSIYAETELHNYMCSNKDRIKGKIRRRLIPVLKRDKDLLYKWLHSHESVYEYLISLGLKDAYLKMKEKIVR